MIAFLAKFSAQISSIIVFLIVGVISPTAAFSVEQVHRRASRFGSERVLVDMVFPKTNQETKLPISKGRLPAVAIGELLGKIEDADWKVIIKFDESNDGNDAFEIAEISYDQIREGEVNENFVLIEGIDKAGTLSVEYVGNSAPLFRLESVTKSTIDTQSLKLFDDISNLIDLADSDSEYARAIFQLQIKQNDGNASTCTAFHIGYGWALTNAHCTHSQSGKEHRAFNAYFVDGEKRTVEVTHGSALTSKSLDYAVLKVRNMPAHLLKFRHDPSKHIEDCDSKRNHGVEFQLFQYFEFNDISGPKLVDGGDLCSLTSKAVKDRRRCLPSSSFQHQCSTAYSSSGSPLISKDTGVLWGLHYGGAAYQTNCATCISSIRADLLEKSKRKPELSEVVELFTPSN